MADCVKDTIFVVPLYDLSVGNSCKTCNLSVEVLLNLKITVGEGHTEVPGGRGQLILQL